MSPVLTGASLATLMDELVAVEETIDPALRVYRWKPRSIQPPAVFNGWSTPGGLAPFVQQDLARWRDTVTISAIIVVAYTDDQVEMARIEGWFDTFRLVVDDALDVNQPLSAACHRARRLGSRIGPVTFNDIEYLGAEFPLEFQLDRGVH